MDNQVQRMDSVCEYNEWMGVETLHPLVSVIDMSTVKPVFHRLMNFGFYAVFLKEVNCGDMVYGRQYYDYQEGTLVFIAPGQVSGVRGDGKPFQPKGWALLFHPDLFRGTALGRNMKAYTFFSYEVREALHLSEQEKQTIVDCMQKISLELNGVVDRHSRNLICTNIQLLLDYCVRFYERQFITRRQVNRDVLMRFETVLDTYFQNEGTIQEQGLPSVKYCASQLFLSPNYFGDLIKRETGKTAQEYIQMKLIDTAKERLLDDNKTLAEVAYGLGFQYPQHFSRFFKRHVGCTPNEYRSLH